MIQSVLIPILVILILVLVNGVFVAAEFSLVGSRRSRLQSLVEDGSKTATWLLGVFDRPTGKDAYIAVAQLGITLASIGLGMYGEPAVATWLYGPFESWGLSTDAAHIAGFAIALGGITYMHVVFGEMIPKALALQGPEEVSIRVNPVMRVFGKLFRPMVVVLNAIAFGLMRLLRIPEPDQSLSLYTSAELEIVTDEAADNGQLGAMQRDLIHNIFDLDERSARELMTSRGQVETIDIAESSEAIAERILASPRSRYPVVDGDLDHVMGVLHIKDFIRAREQESAGDLRSLLRRLPTVAATTSAEHLLQRFKRDRTHASLVVDEFGSAIGLVTLDDIIAEVMDDAIADSAKAVHHDDGSVSLDGETTLTELLDDHGLEFAHPEVTTLAGLVLAEYGSTPQVGVAVDFQGRRLLVEQVEGRKITRVRVYPE